MVSKPGSCPTSPNHIGWSGSSTSPSAAVHPEKGGKKLTIMCIMCIYEGPED